MGNIYVYDAKATDFASVGLVGALTPTECRHEEVGNGMSELTLVHPVDEWGRYAALLPDRILRAPVPVRTCPEIVDGTIVTSFEVWRIKATASKAQRYVFSKKSGGKKKKLLKAGMRVLVTLKDESAGRYKIRYGGAIADGEAGQPSMSRGTSGWISKDALQFEIAQSAPATPGGIEQAEPAWPVRDQLFRVVEVQKSESGKSVTVTALRLFYDLRWNLTNYKNTGTVLAKNALGGIAENLAEPTEFEFYTDIAGSRTGVDWSRMNPVQALLGDAAGFCALWGAQMVRDDEEVYYLSKAGLDRGVRIEYAKNLTGVDCVESIEDVVTRIIPVGQTKKGGELLLDGSIHVDSPHASKYASPHIHFLKCENAKVGGTVTTALARARMREQAQEMFERGCDLPALTVTVDFVNLGDTAEYVQYRGLENVYLYDVVSIHHPVLGIDVQAEVVRHVWDCLNDRVLAIELGSAAGSLATAASAEAMVEARLAALQAEVNDVVGLQLGIHSTGDALGAGISTTTLTARVWRGSVDATEEFEENQFKWTRTSADAAADAAWNASHTGMKAIVLTSVADGVTATYQFDLLGEPLIGEPARRTVVYNNPVVESATEPENPTDGLVWLNTETNVMRVWRDGTGDAGAWEIVADYAGAASLIDRLMQGTIENEDFNDVMVNAGALGDLVSEEKRDLMDNLAKAMDFSQDGLTISSLSGKTAARLGTQQLEFLAGLGTDAVAVAVFGLLQTVTAAYLQVGQSAQSPRLRLGEVILEYQAATGNLTCRRV